MTTPSVSQIAEAIGSALMANAGLRSAAFLSDVVSPPVALVGIDTVDYHGAFAGGDVTHTFTVYVILSRASDRAGLQAMESYMSQAGAQSVKAAVETDPTLGGVVATSFVERSGPPHAIAIGQSGALYLCVPFTVVAHA